MKYNEFLNLICLSDSFSIGYSTIETKEVDRIGYNGFLFPHEYSGDGLGATHIDLHLIIHAEKETRYIQYGPFLLF